MMGELSHEKLWAVGKNKEIGLFPCPVAEQHGNTENTEIVKLCIRSEYEDREAMPRDPF